MTLDRPSDPLTEGAPTSASGPAAKRRWVVYATFDPAGRPSESAVAQVQAYREAGFQVLVVDTSAELSEARRADWRREASCWFQRPNVGYDFGSFKAGLLHLTTERGAEAGTFDLLIANDSCFGPFAPIAPIIETFDRFAPGERWVFGMTDSIQFVHHIQSYWMYFRSNVSRFALEFFFDEMRHAPDRQGAILMGELALGRFLAARDCRFEVVCPVIATLKRLALFDGWLVSTVEFGVRRLFKRWKYNRDADTQCLRHLLHLPSNVGHFSPISLFGVQLYRRCGLPFIKKSLLRDNFHHDPAIPPGLDIHSLGNAEVRALLRSERSSPSKP